MNVPIGAHKGTATPKPTADAAIAAILQLPTEAVTRHRLKFNEDAIMRAVITERLTGQIEERRKQLETISPEDLKAKQGEISGLKTALAITVKNET